MAALESVHVQEVFSFLHHPADVTGVAGTQVMLALQVDSHVVGLVSDVRTQATGEPALAGPVGIAGHNIWQETRGQCLAG